MPQPTNDLIRIAESDVNTPSTGLPNKKEPTSVLQTTGYDKDQIVAGNHLNYIFDNLAEHMVWLQEQITTQGITITAQGATITAQGNTILAQQIKVDGFYLGGAANPATHLLYGTWVQVEADITLRSATSDGTTVSGDNTPTVPLPQHNHTATNSSDGAHNHTFSGTTGSDTHHHDINSSVDAAGATMVANGGTSPEGTVPTLDNTHNHTFSGTTNGVIDHTHTITVDNEGTAGATLDVRGRHLNVVMWKRTA